VPEVFAFDTQGKSSFGVPFVIMEFIAGVVAMDLDSGYDVHHGAIGALRKPIFYPAMAVAQVSSHRCFQSISASD
jgi:hypothetical protein